MTDIGFTLSSGRTMGVTTLGDPFSTRIVVLCHPMPGAGDFDPEPDLTRRANVRMLSFDRPGYGGSEPLGDDEPSTVQARADDIAEFLTSKRMIEDLVGGANFGVVGWGFGGAVALSLAARHPKLIARAAVVGLSKSTLATAKDANPPEIVGVPPQPGPPQFSWESVGVGPDDPALNLPGVADRLDSMLAQSATQGIAGVEADIALHRTSRGPTNWGTLPPRRPSCTVWQIPRRILRAATGCVASFHTRRSHASKTREG